MAESEPERPWARWLAGVLLSVQALLLAWSASLHSPTLNEPGHLAAGLSIWELGRFDVFTVNPPLVRMISAAPVYLAGAQTDWRKLGFAPGVRSGILLGADLVAANGPRSNWYFTMARWACVPLTLLGGYVVWLWARDLYGEMPGLLALTLWCFSPNILAHGQLITCDAAGAALSILAGYAFWCWLKKPTWSNALLHGVALGLAQLAKMTALVFFAISPVVFLCYHLGFRGDRSAPALPVRSAMLIASLAIGLCILNLGYAFDGSFRRLDQFPFRSSTLGGDALQGPPGATTGNVFRGSWLGACPVPLPKHYVMGLDLQRRCFEFSDRSNYLGGEFNRYGWWYHYLYALAIKVPLGTWLLAAIAFGARVFRKRSLAFASRDELPLWFPPLVILVVVSSQLGSAGTLRYALPILPFLYVWISSVVGAAATRNRLVIAAVVAATMWSVASSLQVYPHTLSYFNEAVGGPRYGAYHLLQSNMDWGQDLLFLKKWMEDHPEARPLRLACFSSYDPAHLGVDTLEPDLAILAQRLDDGQTSIPPGWYAISVNYIHGLSYHSLRGVPRDRSLRNREGLRCFSELEPVARAGYSFLIFHVDAPAD